MTAPRFAAVVIGVSAGAMDALGAILPALPRGFPFAILVVVHIPSDKKSLMAELFQARCELTVKEAEDKEKITSGTVYFAPPAYHMLVETNHTISFSTEEPVLFSRPSIDVLFETAADAYGSQLIGIVLTGANNDGAAGLKAIGEAGGATLIQKPSSAYASTMPEAALAACPHAQVMTLAHIVDYLRKAGSL